MQQIDVPRLKPAGPDTWEIRSELDADTLETGRLPLEFPRPYLIVGAHVAVTQVTDTDKIVPTANDILALMDLDNQRRFTAAELIGQTSAASRGAEFVTLGSLDTRFRDLHIRLEAPRPELGVSFRWKITDDAIRENLYEDVIVSIAFICTPLDGK